ncbi:cold shock domain-containing protein [Motilimonas eburnea]|uniref:cold shock domain-containing protein n=1 Tax=Motilimonas eburnea TaxID=1737488 RepID=UPI001E2CA05C|nr:cold shock domain-containing protein [Motilimonas eburnea]MCE2571739.1 cold shock domain-containing protein [Motilimonas eburnea]
MTIKLTRESTWHFGVVKWFNNNTGYGFICELSQSDFGLLNQPDIMLHYREINTVEKRARLSKGELVKFKVRQTVKGKTAYAVEMFKEQLK